MTPDPWQACFDIKYQRQHKFLPGPHGDPIWDRGGMGRERGSGDANPPREQPMQVKFLNLCAGLFTDRGEAVPDSQRDKEAPPLLGLLSPIWD